MDYIDQSGLYVLEEVLIDLKRAGKTVLLVGLKDQPYHMLKLIGIVGGLIPKEHIFKNFKECVPWIKKNVENITNQSI
jgi:SulP family sulfate permease